MADATKASAGEATFADVASPRRMDDEPFLPGHQQRGAAPAATFAGSAGAVPQKPSCKEGPTGSIASRKHMLRWPGRLRCAATQRSG